MTTRPFGSALVVTCLLFVGCSESLPAEVIPKAIERCKDAGGLERIDIAARAYRVTCKNGMTDNFWSSKT